MSSEVISPDPEHEKTTDDALVHRLERIMIEEDKEESRRLLINNAIDEFSHQEYPGGPRTAAEYMNFSRRLAGVFFKIGLVAAGEGIMQEAIVRLQDSGEREKAAKLSEDLNMMIAFAPIKEDLSGIRLNISPIRIQPKNPELEALKKERE